MGCDNNCLFCEEPEKATLHFMEDNALINVATAAAELLAARGMDMQTRDLAWDRLRDALLEFRSLETSQQATSAAIKSLQKIEESLG